LTISKSPPLRLDVHAYNLNAYSPFQLPDIEKVE